MFATNIPGEVLLSVVFKQNPAQNLYKRLGFEIVSETKTHYYMTKKQI